MTLHVEINPHVLQWAVKRTGLSPTDLSDKNAFRKLPSWLTGDSHPTLRQAEKLAKAAGIPFGYLLLDKPTEESVDLPDFRTLKSQMITRVSPNLEDVIHECSQRLAWYAEYATESGIESPDLLGSAQLSESAEKTAKTVAKNIGWAAGTRNSGRDKVAFLSELIEDVGALVMRSSIVGNNSHRPLDVNEFRGFTLVEDGFALIFINTADAKSAQLFSLAHELGHVVLSEPGISGDEQDDGNGHLVERWCNRFAAEFLLPASQIIERFSKDEDLYHFAEEQSRFFGVSREAVLWRLTDLKQISRTDAQTLIDSIRPMKQTTKRRGGDFRNNTRTRLGRRYLGAVVDAAVTGKLAQLDAARFLGVRRYKSFRDLLEFTLKDA